MVREGEGERDDMEGTMRDVDHTLYAVPFSWIRGG